MATTQAERKVREDRGKDQRAKAVLGKVKSNFKNLNVFVFVLSSFNFFCYRTLS